MRHFHLNRNHYFCPTVNIDTLWTLVPEEARKAATPAKAPVIDVTKAGFFKVLGKGRLPATPFVLRTKFITKKAEKKIKEAGGVIEITA